MTKCVGQFLVSILSVPHICLSLSISPTVFYYSNFLICILFMSGKTWASSCSFCLFLFSKISPSFEFISSHTCHLTINFSGYKNREFISPALNVWIFWGSRVLWYSPGEGREWERVGWSLRGTSSSAVKAANSFSWDCYCSKAPACLVYPHADSKL